MSGIPKAIHIGITSDFAEDVQILSTTSLHVNAVVVPFCEYLRATRSWTNDGRTCTSEHFDRESAREVAKFVSEYISADPGRGLELPVVEIDPFARLVASARFDRSLPRSTGPQHRRVGGQAVTTPHTPLLDRRSGDGRRRHHGATADRRCHRRSGPRSRRQ